VQPADIGFTLRNANSFKFNSLSSTGFGKNTGTGNRNAFMGYTDTFFLLLVIMVIQILQIH
jgi:hypothetical protein